MRTTADRTGAIGVAVVEMIVNRDLGWIFRRQDHAGTDHGIDAQVEVVDDDGTVTGRLLALQIKAGPHYFRRRHGDTFAVDISARHLGYWSGHSLPVLLVLVDIKAQITYWHLVQPPIELTTTGGTLYVPERNQLSAAAKRELRSFTQTPAELRAERDAARREAARLAAIVQPKALVKPPTPERTIWEIREDTMFGSSFDALADTSEIMSTISAIIASIAHDPFVVPAIEGGIRIVKTRPYQGFPGVRLGYFIDAAGVVILLFVEEYGLKSDEGHHPS